MKKISIFRRLLLATMLLLAPIGASAQVTIGSGKAPESFSLLELVSADSNNGLRLPQLTTAQRNALSAANGSNALFKGLTIYNTSNDCVEYWNAARWVSLCEGNSQMVVSPAPCTDVSADGTGCAGEFAITDPDCESGPFSFAIVAGADFASFASLDETAGKFSLLFQPNNSTAARSVVVRVTGSCTGLYKDFLFSQDGQGCPAASGTAPTVSASPAGAAICASGSVFLSIPANTPNLSDIIWTRNGAFFAQGVSYLEVTSPGAYSVSIGFAGCGWANGNANVVNVSTSGSTAPGAVTTVISENGGIICGAGGSVTLTAMGSPTGVAWFQDGTLRSDKSGASISLSATDAGEWFAAIQDGACYSRSSNIITVAVDASGAGQVSLNPADVLVNGSPIGSVTGFCPGGSLVLSVNNAQAGVTYTWFNDNTAIGSSNPLNYIVPAAQNSMLLRLVATDNSGAQCPAEANSTEQSISGVTPSVASISAPSGACSGQTVRSTATPAGADQYEWFFNGASQGFTANNYLDSSAGTVNVRYLSGGCWSPQLTTPAVIAAQNPPNINIGDHTTSFNSTDSGIEFPFSVILTQGSSAATGYTWSVTPAGAAVITPDGTGSAARTARISFTAACTISVVASNNCGNSNTVNVDVTMISTTLPAPAVSPVSGSYCNAVTFTITRPGSGWTDAQWSALSSSNISATLGGAAYNGALTSDGTNYYYTVTASSSSDQAVTLNFTGSVGGVNITPLGSAISGINVRTSTDSSNSSISLVGRNCFDIAYVNEGATCSTIAQRAAYRANFGSSYAYTLGGSLGSGVTITNVQWTYDVDYNGITAPDAVTVFTPSALNPTALGSNSVNVTFNPSLLTAALGEQGIVVTVTALVTTSGGACGTASYLVRQIVRIRDCACCGSDGTALPMQIGSNTYLTHLYMTNGVERCWMVENSKEGTPRNMTLTGSTNSTSVWNQYSGQAVGARGYYYVWQTAQTDACPTGWSVPTVAEFGANNTQGLWATLNAMPANANSDNPRRFWNGDGSALAGARYINDTWNDWGTRGYWWSSASGANFNGNPAGALDMYLTSFAGFGFSVRCIQNQ